jgi:hypothetical protein
VRSASRVAGAGFREEAVDNLWAECVMKFPMSTVRVDWTMGSASRVVDAV